LGAEPLHLEQVLRQIEIVAPHLKRPLLQMEILELHLKELFLQMEILEDHLKREFLQLEILELHLKEELPHLKQLLLQLEQVPLQIKKVLLQMGQYRFHLMNQGNMSQFGSFTTVRQDATARLVTLRRIRAELSYLLMISLKTRSAFSSSAGMAICWGQSLTQRSQPIQADPLSWSAYIVP
jgi:hypothetical protein